MFICFKRKINTINNDLEKHKHVKNVPTFRRNYDAIIKEWNKASKMQVQKECTANKSASIYPNQILLSRNRLQLSPWSFTKVFKKIETTMTWSYMSKDLRFLQITAEHQNCPFFTVFLLAIKTSSQNISMTLSQIPLKLHEHLDGSWRKKLPWTILEEQLPVPRKTAASKIGDGVSSFLRQLLCQSLQPWS